MPVYANNLYYVDAIGNISESNAYRGIDEVRFEIKPRFPVMGGWKTSWSQGYLFPADKYISYNEQDSTQYVFTTQLSHQYEGITAEDFTLKIILPEGASNIQINLPF